LEWRNLFFVLLHFNLKYQQKGGTMLDSVKSFQVGQSSNAVKQSQQKVSFKGSALPQSIKVAKADSFKKNLSLGCGVDYSFEDG
jgi:hypothetical protein